jgi:hypothetical protein
MKLRETMAVLSVAGLFAAAADAQGRVTTSCTGPSGHHIYAEARNCPIGGGKYDALRLGTHSTYGSYTDLSRVSYLQFPIAMPVCPDNGFVDFQEDYTPDEIEAFTAVVGSADYKALLGKHTSYFLLARMIEMAGKTSEFDMWWLDNVAASEAASCNLPVFEDYTRRALASSSAALENAKTDADEYWPLQLININDLRELGEFDAAAARLSALTDIPEDWTTAFDTLREAVLRKVKGRVRIGEYAKDSDDQ